VFHFSNISSGNFNNITIINGQIVGGGNGLRPEGPRVSRTIPLSQSSRLNHSAIGDLRVCPNESNKVELLVVNGRESFVEDLEASMDHGTVNIRMNSDCIMSHSSDDLNMTLYTNSRFEDLKVSLSGEINLSGVNTSPTALDIDIHGSGRIAVDNVNTDEITAQISGSGSMIVSGSAKQTDVSISGSGTFQGRALSLEKAKLRVSGSGSINLGEISTKVKARVSGSGNLNYSFNGNSNNESTSVSGSGSINGVGRNRYATNSWVFD